MTATAGADRLRNLVFFRTPSLWQVWPFLPLMRRKPGREEECGLLYDARGQSGLMGYSATVFLLLCGTPHKQSYADPAVMRSWWA